MEEDVEINILLEKNEAYLKEVAQPSGSGVISGDTEDMDSDTQVQVWDTNWEEEGNRKKILNIVNVDTVDDIDDEVGDLLEGQMILYKIKEIQESKNIGHINSYNEREADMISESDDDFLAGITGEKQNHVRNNTNCKRTMENEETDPVSVLQQALHLNLLSQEMCMWVETKLANNLKENQKKQADLKDELFAMKYDSCYKPKVDPSCTRNFFYKFGIPYFEDSNGFGGPSNDDYKTKVNNKELIIIDLPKVKFWKKAEKKMLQEGVKECLIREQTDQFNYRIKKLKEFLVNSDGDESNVVMDELQECQEKLDQVNKISFNALIANEHNDREYDWMKISVINFNGEHSPEECQRYWHVYLKPSINKGPWEMIEDLKLSELVQEYKFQDWDNIAKALGTNRSAYQCFVHSQTRIYSKNNHTTGKWTKEEDKMLLSIISASKIGDYIPWTKVASHLGTRTLVQIYSRWRNCLNPALVKGRFTKDEDMLIVAGIRVLGASYPQLATVLERRTSTQIRERYLRHLQSSVSNIGPWSLVEDEQLMDLIKEHGESNWQVISKHIGTRTRTQVRQRYSFIRKMKERNPEWTIYCVKRKTKYHAPKEIELTKKYVEKFKEKYAHLEELLNMSKFERDKFRAEKLQDLTSKLKQTRRGRQKKVLSDGAPVNNMLLDYFKPSYRKPFLKSKNFYRDYDSLKQQMSIMFNFLGHEIELPSEKDIWNNPKLDKHLKVLLSDIVRKESAEIHEMPSTSNEEPIIDYTPQDDDDTLIMQDSWFSPTVDVSCFNFSELLKRTVFDYSSGMHRDIWEAKMKRSINTSVGEHFQLKSNKMLDSPSYYIPPNCANMVALRTILLSRNRLKREVRGETYETQLREEESHPECQEERETNSSSLLIKQFQETVLTLLTWPKALSTKEVTKDSESPKRTKQVALKVKRKKQKSNCLANAVKSKITLAVRTNLPHGRRGKRGRGVLKDESKVIRSRTKKENKTYSHLPIRVSHTRSVKRKRLNEMDSNNIEINDQPESSKTVTGNEDEPNSTETVNSPRKQVRECRKKCEMERNSSDKPCEERPIRPICNIRSPVQQQSSRTSCLSVTNCAPKLRVQKQRRCKNNVENPVGGVKHKPEEREDQELDTQMEVEEELEQ